MQSVDYSFFDPVYQISMSLLETPLRAGRYMPINLAFVAGCLTTATLLGRRGPAISLASLTTPLAPSALSELYLATVAKSVTGILLETPFYTAFMGKEDLTKAQPFDVGKRTEGSDWPVYGITMCVR